MPSIRIGVHVHAEPGRLLATLEALRANTARDYDLLLLPDGPDAHTLDALDGLRDIAQSATPAPGGAPACFNRLAASCDADVIILLESGSLVGPGWLEWLLAALGDDPRNGLAGPSTNLSWNEQGIFAGRGGTAEEVAETAASAARHFGGQTRTLEPLYSLADFCYAVRREVVEAVGAADEGYGLGPCWEMDYNVRAARAGFRGVWACGSYVYRPPYTARRIAAEARLFETSKRIYQGKFCGALLRRERGWHRPHCSGDACPNFAPAGLIEVRLPLGAAAPAAEPGPSPPAAGRASVVPRAPLVTCVMPTRDRRPFIAQALRCFGRQDYENLELLVVDDGESIADCLPEGGRVRYVRPERRLTLGAKRNFACEQARGEIVVHWDDDDWYPPWRVGAQVRALLDGRADVSGSSRVFYFRPSDGRAWEYRYFSPGAVWVAGNTLAFRKSFWERNRFPDVQVGEDSLFLRGDPNCVIADLAEPSLCLGVVHAGNTSPKETDGMFWHETPRAGVAALLGDDLNFYRAGGDAEGPEHWPLVSCIMPTYGRRPFVPLALSNFLKQDYPRKELVVVDDGDDAVEDLLRDAPGVVYLRMHARASIGAKRNVACRHARGELIAHWDDDDWYSHDRLRYQALPILAGEADVTGLENSSVLELPGGEFWTTDAELHSRMFVGDVHGGTLVYRRGLLDEGLIYPEVNLAEDAWLLHNALRMGKRLVRLSNPGVFVYVRHGGNAWREFAPGSFIEPGGWRRVGPPLTFPAGARASYVAAAARA
ncbi:MAG TPA: glycosyltransferase [Pyrinomonadaceae bacterium]|jgi:glycosyltransferase involved in cell wall biosynthesis